MTLPNSKDLLLDISDCVLTITINRPQKRNALNKATVEDFMATFAAIESNRDIRAVIIRGADGHFCSGGDISDMATSSDDTTDPIWEFNRIFGRMITQADQLPQVVITCLEGAVLGGGFGLACVSDVAVADKHAKFGMPETGLGIIPAQIAPFVVKRIGLTEARRLALLGEWVSGVEAKEIGLVHYVTDGTDAMNQKLSGVLKKVKRVAPNATAATKDLLHKVGTAELESVLDDAATLFASALMSDEGQEGTAAFMNKRKPNWAE